MRRRLASAALLLAFAALTVPSAQAAAEEIDIRRTGGARFPHVAFVLNLGEQTSLQADRVEVRENDTPISTFSLIPAGAGGARDFGVVLVIDASGSMRGAPIEGAVDAARAFAAKRAQNQQLAIIMFNEKAEVVLPFTNDGARIQDALAQTPTLAQGTHIYDAVKAAISLLREERIAAGSILLLSDGDDTGSDATEATVAAAARKAHVRLFSIGLRSRWFNSSTLAGLAKVARGSYSEATSTSDLQRIYTDIGSLLANEYLLRYRSLAGPEEPVHVEVRIEGVPRVAATDYVTPALAVKGAGPFERSVSDAFWQSGAAMVLASGAAALMIALAAFALLRPHRRNLRRRMSEFVSLPAAKERNGQGASLTGKVLGGTEKSLERTKWWTRFKEDLEIAQIRIPPVQIVLWTVVATIFAMWFIQLVTGFTLAAALGLAVPLFVRSLIRRRLDRRRRQFAEQLPDNLQVLASALRAGHSFVGALSVVVDDAPEPAQSEFKRVIADEQLGVPLEDALAVVVRRMDNRDLEQVALVAALQRQTGGNSAEVLDRVTETIRERFELRRMVKTLTAQGRMSRWIVSFLPVLLLGAITLLNPTYIQPLYTHPVGRLLLVFAAVLVVAGSLVIKRIVDIKV